VDGERAVRYAAIWDFLRMPQVDFVEPILSAP
jgi:hypothetical protein